MPEKIVQFITMKLIFATHNRHKADEIRAVLNNNIEIITLEEAGIVKDIPELYNSLEENASAKSATIYKITGYDCFSEDTGLEVWALNGEPGIKSARYAGDHCNSDENIDKLLANLAGHTDRSARFRTVLSLFIDGKETLFEGTCTGRITEEKRGTQGFGYDPVFIPDGDGKTFAEMNLDEKNRYSHRKKATEKLVAFLNKLSTNH